MSFRDFDRQIPSSQLTKLRQHEAAMERSQKMQRRWLESERILSILRSINSEPATITEEGISSWYDGVQKHAFVGEEVRLPDRSNADSPNQWFHLRFPKQAKIFGNAFLEEHTGSHECRPVFLNTDFFAAMLGGESALGHQVVFIPAENQFFFWDAKQQAFRHTSTAKLQTLASNYLIKCAESFTGKSTIIPLLDDFRRPVILQSITQKAKAILEAERTFFEGPHGRVRYIDGRCVNPADEPAHKQFVEKVLTRQPGARTTVSEVYTQYVEFCHMEHLPILTASEFRKVIPRAIEDTFGVRIRHDIPDHNGKHHHGWAGLGCLPR